MFASLSSAVNSTTASIHNSKYFHFRKNSGTSSNVTSGGTKNNNNNISIHNKNNGPSAKFSKGSLIELASGELKRVEDMRAEDFSISSLKNSELQVIDTTVLKMSPNARGVVITFTFNNSTVRSTISFFSHQFGRRRLVGLLLLSFDIQIWVVSSNKNVMKMENLHFLSKTKIDK